MKNIKEYNDFINEEFMGFFKKPIEKLKFKKSCMTEEDDISTDFSYLLKRAYDNDSLYIKNFSINDRVEIEIPYSDNKKRNISIQISNGIVYIMDRPRNFFRGQTDDVEYYQDIINTYIDKLKDTKFDKS